LFFFFQAEDGIRDFHVTGVQTCALPILLSELPVAVWPKLNDVATDTAADHTGHRLVAGHDPAAVPRRGHVGDRQRPAPVATAWDERLASGLRFGEREPGRERWPEHARLA